MRSGVVPGVNLVGYASSPLGLGEDLRQAAYALVDNGIPVNIIDVNPSKVDYGYDRLMQYVGEEFIFPISIFFMSPFAYKLYASKNQHRFSHTYKIGNFLWELEDFPPSYIETLSKVDEIWIPTAFVERIYRKIGVSKLFVNPTPAIPPVKTQGSFRAQLGYADDTFVFGFMFDLHSTPQRKNPMALLRAYEKCRLLSLSRCNTALLIKVHRADRSSPHFDAIKAYASSIPGVHLYEKTLNTGQVVDFYNTIDAYVSLHRSEGLGRTIVEAAQLGLPTICTGYSGETDVIERSEVVAVPYTLTPCAPGEYPNSEGSVWAEPSSECAAVLMARVSRQGRHRLSAPVKLNAHFSTEAFVQRAMVRFRAILTDDQKTCG